MTKNINRLIEADAVRAYAILAMVLYHSTGTYMPFYYKADSHSWGLIAEVIRISTAPCVPLFIMLSGMLLLGKNESLSLFFGKRFRKVLLPFVVWVGLHFVWLIYVEGKSYSALEIILNTLKGPVYPHLWFMYMLIGLYLATPIFRVFCQNSDNQTLLYFIILWLIGVGVVPIIEKIFTCKINLQMAVTTSYAGYFVAGYYFKNLTFSSNQIKLAFCGVVTLIILTTLGIEKFSAPGSIKFLTFFIGFTRINIILISFLIFLILKSLDYTNKGIPGLEAIIIYLSKTSFGIYLVHYAINMSLRNGNFGFTIYKFRGEWLPPVPGIFLVFMATMLISMFVVSTLQSIPYLKRIVP